MRQNWVQLALPSRPVDYVELFDTHTLPLFRAHDSELKERTTVLARTLDRCIYQGSENVLMYLPTEPRRYTVQLLDMRLLGWVKQSQWELPTSFDQWMTIVKLWEPFAVKSLGDNMWQLTLWENPKANIASWAAWQFEIETTPTIRPIRITKYRNVAVNHETVVCLRVPLFDSVFEYDTQSHLLKKVCYGNIDGGHMWQCDVFHAPEYEVKNEIFDISGFLDAKRILVSEALKRQIEFELKSQEKN